MKIADKVVWRTRLELGVGIVDHLNMSGPVVHFIGQPLMCIPEAALIKLLPLKEKQHDTSK